MLAGTLAVGSVCVHYPDSEHLAERPAPQAIVRPQLAPLTSTGAYAVGLGGGYGYANLTDATPGNTS